MADQPDGTGARLNRVRDMLRDQIISTVQAGQKAAGKEPLGAWEEMDMTERKQLLAQLEQSGWAQTLDDEAQKQGIPNGGIHRNVIKFAVDTMRSVQRELETEQLHVTTWD